MAQFTFHAMRALSAVRSIAPRLISAPRISTPSLSSVRLYGAAYEADGKTKVNILNKELDLGLMVNGFSQYGFRLNNDMVIMGPMAIFPRYTYK